MNSSCPWDAYKIWGLPNVDWCENAVCSWIEDPANTWSNLAYIVVGFYLVYRACKAPKNALISALGMWMILVGIFSGIFHASNLFPTQLLDFYGMYLFLFGWVYAFPEVVQMASGRPFSRGPYLGRVILVATAVTAIAPLLMKLHVSVQLSFILVLVFCLFKTKKYFNRSIYRGLLFLGAAELCSILDINRWVCSPDQHWLHGHAVWHLLSAVGMYFLVLGVQDFSRIQNSIRIKSTL